MAEKQTTALQPRREPETGMEIARPQPAAMDIEGLFRYAVENKVSSETMKDLMAIRRELKAEEAKAQFDASLAAFQSECPIVEKRKVVFNKDGRTVRYRYAPLDDIVLQVKGLLDRHGFSYSLDTASSGPSVKAICEIKCAGHSVHSSFEVPIDKDAYMNNQQQFASALTFAKRYAFCNAFGILTGDEDTDANTAKEKPAGPSSIAPASVTLKELAAELWQVLKPVRGAEKNWKEANQFCWDEAVISDTESLPDLGAARFREVIEAAKKKLKALGK